MGRWCMWGKKLNRATHFFWFCDFRFIFSCDFICKLSCIFSCDLSCDLSCELSCDFIWIFRCNFSCIFRCNLSVKWEIKRWIFEKKKTLCFLLLASMNFMESCLHAFHTHTDWSTSNYFSLLNSKSQGDSMHDAKIEYFAEILDFLPPNQPFTLSVAKNVSFNLKSSFNLTLPSSHAVSFLYSSHDIQPGCRIFQPASTIKPLLLYGKLYQDGRLEALSSYRLHPHVQLVTTGLSTLGEKSQVHVWDWVSKGGNWWFYL